MSTTEEIINRLTEQMQNITKATREEIKKIRANKIDPEVFNDVLVMAYGLPTPLPQLANIKNIDTRTIEIKPWEKSLLQEIEKGIIKSNLGLTPQNNGEVIIIIAPQLTEDRRKQLVKLAKEQIEKDKIKIRNIRQKMKEELKGLKEGKISQDKIKATETKIQKTTDSCIQELDQIFEEKQKTLMQI